MLLEMGDAAQRIMETASEVKCGLLLLGSRGRGGFKESLLGSVSHKITNHADCPVLKRNNIMPIFRLFNILQVLARDIEKCFIKCTEG
jgi:hypothetical protein